jgi:hypothetical protein
VAVAVSNRTYIKVLLFFFYQLDSVEVVGAVRLINLKVLFLKQRDRVYETSCDDRHDHISHTYHADPRITPVTLHPCVTAALNDWLVLSF